MRRTAATRRLRADAAVLVAIVLVVQALFGGLASGAVAAAGPGGFDIICGRDAGQRDAGPSGPSGAPAHLADCCTLGCPMAAAAPPPPALPAIRCPAAAAADIATPDRGGVRLARAELAPRHTRAPPEA